MEHQWETLTKGKLIGFAAGVGALLWLVLSSTTGFVFLLDHANLLFHEAGHPVIGLFSSRLEPYGGTVGQLVFPLVIAVSFWRKRQPVGVAAGGLWFFENFFNIARYMADARALQLPLVGGGDHDWNTILSRWGLLQYDTQIAHAVHIAGWLGFSAVICWFSYRAWKDHAHPSFSSQRPGESASCQ